ncbi:MAG: hypothetical protein ACLP0J_28865 [Solirubrobacteraceae bacterium]
MTTIYTDHANELILVDDVLDPRGDAAVALGLLNQDGSDTFPGRTLTPDQAEELAANLARAAAAARATAGLAPAPLGGEQAHDDTLKAVRAAVALTSAAAVLADDHDAQAGATVPIPDTPKAAPISAPAPAATPISVPAPAATPISAPAPAATPISAPVPAATPISAPVPAAKPIPAPAPAAKPSPARQPAAKPRTSGKGTSSSVSGAAREDRHVASGAKPRDRAGELVELPIADYDKLSAAVVTKRLDGLSGAQLSKLLAYEQGHRNRKTVCERIVALQSSAARATKPTT